MKNIKQTENLIIIILWLCVLATFPYALLNNYVLLSSDILGLTGLTFLTTLSIYNPKLKFKGLMILLLLGLFNLVSFVYFFNIAFSFGISTFLTPHIQLLSLILIVILVIKRANKFGAVWIKLFGQTEKETEQRKESLKNGFKSRFNKLTDEEIEKKLQNKLVEEARQALIEIQNERNHGT
jgi:hypothetical protein